jgi:hypothetical protein
MHGERFMAFDSAFVPIRLCPLSQGQFHKDSQDSTRRKWRTISGFCGLQSEQVPVAPRLRIAPVTLNQQLNSPAAAFAVTTAHFANQRIAAPANKNARWQWASGRIN